METIKSIFNDLAVIGHFVFFYFKNKKFYSVCSVQSIDMVNLWRSLTPVQRFYMMSEQGLCLMVFRDPHRSVLL